MFKRKIVVLPSGKLYDKILKQYVSHSFVFDLYTDGDDLEITDKDGRNKTDEIISMLLMKDAHDYKFPGWFLKTIQKSKGGSLKGVLNDLILSENGRSNFLFLVFTFFTVLLLSSCSLREFKKTIQNSFNTKSIVTGLGTGITCALIAKELSPNPESEKVNMLLFGSGCTGLGAATSGYAQYLNKKEEDERKMKGSHIYEDYYESSLPVEPYDYSN